jgi:hypothetical protein
LLNGGDEPRVLIAMDIVPSGGRDEVRGVDVIFGVEPAQRMTDDDELAP